MTSQPESTVRPSRAALDEIFQLKYGDPATTGWAPRMRHRFGYDTPDDVYEAVVAALVTEGCSWIDVGCGRDVFPSNRPLAQLLSDRCGVLVGVDPAPTLDENTHVHERVAGTMDDFRSDRQFDLVTLRMVAEHVEDPTKLVESLSLCTRPGGHVVIYTPNRWSPVPIVTHLLPFSLHQPIKRFLWRTEERDTFPTRFRMNTRGRLRQQFTDGGFAEAGFAYLDDCRSLARFRPGLFLELSVRTVLRKLGLGYPENCLLGVYRRN